MRVLKKVVFIYINSNFNWRDTDRKQRPKGASKKNAALIWTLSKTGLTPHPPQIFGSFMTLFRKSKLLELLEHFSPS